MNSLWNFILERINKSQHVILLCVPDSKGSSPGRTGFKMAVAEDGLSGSIGGGIMEYKFVEMAKERLKNLSDDAIIRKQYHNKSAHINQSGMICSGEQTIILFSMNENHSDAVENIIASLENHRNGRLKISPGELSFYDNDGSGPDFYFEMKSENDWQYEERTGFKNQLYIIGGGHCALALSKLMKKMNFYIRLYEERTGLNTFDNNSFVHEKIIIPEYSTLEKLIPPGKNNYVVIMTFGYRTDDIALRALIRKNFKYLGVLGSQSKIERMLIEWEKDNLPEDKLKKIYAPIGFNINSHTPEEIAISIAAEIISVKNKD